MAPTPRLIYLDQVVGAVAMLGLRLMHQDDLMTFSWQGQALRPCRSRGRRSW
jgi:hypothetical protein